MAASPTAIANLALGHCLGQTRIESLSEDSTAARWANEYYAHARDYVTELMLWRYAKRTQTLEETDNDRSSDFDYAYTRPSDCLSFKYVLPLYGAFNAADPIRFECEGEVIYTDEYQARGVYCRQITDTTKFPPSIDSAMGWYLAHLLVVPLRMENNLLRVTADGFAGAVNHAIATGACEQLYVKSAEEAMPDWMRAR
jgi:hypothetical protein